MKVKCVMDHNSTQLFVGEMYECTSYRARYIYIKGLSGTFLKEQFRLENGDHIPNGSYQNNELDLMNNSLNRENVVENLVVICVNENLKTLTYKKIYHIDKIDNGRISVKENDDGRLYARWNFRIVPVDKLRELELESLLGDNDDIEKLTSDYDSYGHLTEYEKVQLMLKATLDAMVYKNKTGSSIPLFNIMKKRGLKSSLYKIEDFNSLSNVDWEEFLSK